MTKNIKNNVVLVPIKYNISLGENKTSKNELSTYKNLRTIFALVDGDDANRMERAERSGTLARGLCVLEVLCQAAQPLAIADITDISGLDQSTLHRLLKTLEDERYVIRNDATRRYFPTPKLLHPLALVHPLDQLRRESGPTLKEITQRLQRTTVLVMFVGWERLVLDITQIAGSLTPYDDTWLQVPLHATAGGKALLQGADAAQRKALLGPGPFKAVTPHTLTQWEQLHADLRLSGERGWMLSRDEHYLGVTNVATTITRWTGGAAGYLIAIGHIRDLNDAKCTRSAKSSGAQQAFSFTKPPASKPRAASAAADAYPPQELA